MSESDREIAKVGGCGGGVNVNDDDDDDDVGQKKKKKKQSRGFANGCLCTKNFRKAKKVILFPITKAKKQLYRQNKSKSNSLCCSSSSAAANANASGERDGSSITKGGCFCFKQPLTLESPIESQTSDPNDPSFSYEMLKVLIEKNDFYSKECNPHLD